MMDSKAITDSSLLFGVGGDGLEMFFVCKTDGAGIWTSFGNKHRWKVFGGGLD